LHPLSNNSSNIQNASDWLSIKTEDGTRLPDLRVEIGGMQSVAASGSMPALDIQHNLVMTLRDDTPVLIGRITNNSEYAINGATLVTSSGWVSLGDLPPGNTVPVNKLLINNNTISAVDLYAITSTLGLNTYGEADMRRRASFFQANMTTNAGIGYVNSGVYLMGWLDEIPAPVELRDQDSKSTDTMLYFEKLSPAVETEEGDVQLTSSIYGWESSVGDSITTSYYNMTEDGYTIRFQPSVPVSFREVKMLELDIQSNVLPAKILVSLWNFETGEWNVVQLLNYGVNHIPEAWKYVDRNGEIRLNINSDPNDYVEITGINFTLTVLP
ncbi:MAG: hypothetical protein HYZ23_10555, partial [Chloroflexi bacterium]|nr:hypothetical protein [Chloroflexota bacterium]